MTDILQMVASIFSWKFKSQKLAAIDTVFSLYHGSLSLRSTDREKTWYVWHINKDYSRFAEDNGRTLCHQIEGSFKSVKSIVGKLSQTIEGSRNTSMDIFYVSVELADELWYELESARFSNMELNRKYIPEMLKIDKNSKFRPSKFLFSKAAVVPNRLRSYSY